MNFVSMFFWKQNFMLINRQDWKWKISEFTCTFKRCIKTPQKNNSTTKSKIGWNNLYILVVLVSKISFRPLYFLTKPDLMLFAGYLVCNLSSFDFSWVVIFSLSIFSSSSLSLMSFAGPSITQTKKMAQTPRPTMCHVQNRVKLIGINWLKHAVSQICWIVAHLNVYHLIRIIPREFQMKPKVEMAYARI